MAVNKNALIRYKTIDKCLQNRYRKWTLEDLIEECSEALYEYEGIDKGVSKRSVQSDIQMMRSDKLGYNAPIVVIDRKYYTYEDPDYSITNIPISDQDLDKMNEAVELLRQFKGFSHFKELDATVQKLEDHVYSQKTKQRPVIDFEKNENLKGLEHLDTLYQAIIQKQSLTIEYQSFKARQANNITFHPYLLKEFRNRWFILGMKNSEKNLYNLALDRIISISKSKAIYKERDDFDPETYFKNVIGVSVNDGAPGEEVQLFITHKHAPYVETKPFHWSQKTIERNHFGIIIQLFVQHNFELEKDILGLGDGVKVIMPKNLKENIQNRMNHALDLYKSDVSEHGLEVIAKQLHHKGTSIVNHIFTRRELRKIHEIIGKYFKEQGTDLQAHPIFALRNLLQIVPNLKDALINPNIKAIINTIDPKAQLTKAIYFDKPSKSNWTVPFHQDGTINIADKIESEGFTKWLDKKDFYSVIPPFEISENTFTIRIHLDDTNAENGNLNVIPGSHNKRLNNDQINLIIENSSPVQCEVGAGGVHIMKPMILHSSSKSTRQKRRRVIHLEFSSLPLPNGLEYAEYQKI